MLVVRATQKKTVEVLFNSLELGEKQCLGVSMTKEV